MLGGERNGAEEEKKEARLRKSVQPLYIGAR